MNKDCVSEILNCCRKREEILLRGKSITTYNKYFDILQKAKRVLFAENRQDELLPYLESDSISIRSDIAGILFHYKTERCTKILQEIAEMKVSDGLPKQFVILSVAAGDNLKYGIPKDYP